MFFLFDTDKCIIHPHLHRKESPEELTLRCNTLCFPSLFFILAPNSPPTLAKRILDTYLEEELWYLPLEVRNEEPPITDEETLDIEVYNPRSWIKESTPGE